MKTKRVLIADDEPVFVRALTMRCKHLGLEVATTSDAMGTLRAIHAEPPDLLFLDVNMPAGSGLAVCEMMMSDAQLPPIPVIILTGRSDEETIRRCEELGAHYVHKTADVWDQLKPIVCELLDIHADGPGGVEPSAASRPETPQSSSEPLPPKVLLIDDDPMFSTALKIKLGVYGIHVRVACNAMQGYWTALKEKPDVVITDYVMPEGYGNYLLGRLKDHTATKDIPVIMVTGRTGSGKRDFALERAMRNLGAAAVFGKPLDFEALLGELRSHINVPAQPAAATQQPASTGRIFC